MEGPRQRSPFRSFALGGLVGAAGAIAAVRRLRTPASRRRAAPAGLAAFEGAPCFDELAAHESRGRREGGAEPE